MPLKIQRGDIARSLMQRFGIKGLFPMQLDEVAVPVVLVSDMRELTENPSSPGTDVRAAGIILNSGGGIAGNGIASELQNPAGSERIILLDRLFANMSGFDSPVNLTGQFISEPDFNAAPASSGRWFRDTRLGSTADPDEMAGRFGTQQSHPAPLSGDLAYHWTLIADDTGTGPPRSPTFDVGDLGIILRPGTGFRLQLDDDSIATDFGSNFVWRERPQ